MYLSLFYVSGSRSPVRTPPAAPFYPPLHSMWSFGAHHGTPTSALNGSASGTPTSKDLGTYPVAYPPTPPIDLKSGPSDNQQQHLQIQSPHQTHQNYLQQQQQQPQNQIADLTAEAIAVSGITLPSLASIDTKNSDHLMSSLGFPSYSSSSSTASVASVAAASAVSRKFHEGNNGMGSPVTSGGTSGTVTYLQPNEASSVTSNVTSTPAYPYFTSPGVDLYATSAASSYGSNGLSSSATGVFSSRTLQPTRPRSKSRANAGKIEMGTLIRWWWWHFALKFACSWYIESYWPWVSENQSVVCCTTWCMPVFDT